jgi:DNA-binding winged helix-turn-helix (wHTH) protein/TolB-like protein
MSESTSNATWADFVDLARESDFDLAWLRVRPARCEVERNGVTQNLQRRVMQVLVALVRAKGSVVSQDDLVRRCWSGLTVSDDAIFRCISKLRKLAASFPARPYEIETIPGVGYRLTPSAFAGHDARAAPAFARNRSRALFMGGVVLLLLMGVTSWMFFNDASQRYSLRVAVQPFEALSNTEDAHSLARRIPNEIVNQLGDSQIEIMLVEDKLASESKGIASGLLVTGILRDDGQNTNVDVRVEDGRTRDALWSMQFKRSKVQASDLPLEIAARVADEVNIATFARTANSGLRDNAALSALLQVTDMIRDPPNGAWAQMINRAQALVTHHPKFAFGHDVLAVAYAEAAQNIDDPDRSKGMRDAATREANLTLKLDPEDAGAYVILSDLQPTYDHRAREAILVRGIKLAKHPKEPLGGLYSAQGRLLDNVGRLRESISVKLVAHATDEWGAPKTAQLARAYANLGNRSAAREWLQKGLQLWPNHSGVRRVRQYIAGFYEPPSDAVAVFESADAKTSPDNAAWTYYIEARAGRSPILKAAAIRQIRAAADESKIRHEIEIMMIAGLGDAAQALQAANSTIDRHESLQTWFLFTPVTRNLRQDPGFIRLAARTGLIRYWRETGKHPDFCTDKAMRSECTPQLRAALK